MLESVGAFFVPRKGTVIKMAKEKSTGKKRIPLELSSIFCIAKEMIEDNGEDSYYYQYDKDRFIISAFDGCGGSGAKKYDRFSGKTGAYVASRAVSGALNVWFEQSGDIAEIKNYVDRAMENCKWLVDDKGGKRMMGSLGKDFPTTAAIITGKVKDAVELTVVWAGDSRCYLLSEKGLCQLSEDDLDGQDAMSNLLNDGVMTNVISASTPFVLHTKKITVKERCVLLCSTDGCFGYLNSPMAFEHLILETMTRANSIAGWKEFLDESFAQVAGDDYTLTVAAIGFRDYEDISSCFGKRLEYLEKKYIDSKEEVTKLWEEYKPDYSVYLNETAENGK